MSNKIMIAVFLLAFWLVYPVPMMFMQTNAFENLGVDPEGTDVDIDEDPGITDFYRIIVSSFGLIGQYFYILVVGIPGAPFLINLVLTLFKIISGIVIFLMIRGD